MTQARKAESGLIIDSLISAWEVKLDMREVCRQLGRGPTPEEVAALVAERRDRRRNAGGGPSREPGTP